MIKFKKHYVIDTNKKIKARILYRLDNNPDGKKCVMVYQKYYDPYLSYIFPDDFEGDKKYPYNEFFKAGTVTLFENHKFYLDARKQAEININKKGTPK